MEFQSGFSKLINSLPASLKVLDVGSGGLEGENTTNYLIRRFGPENITGICSNQHEVERFHAIRAELKLPPVKIIQDDFYKHEFTGQYDLAVLDLNIESNLGRDWTDEGLDHMRSLVKDGGYLINYIMLTDQYGDPDETPLFIYRKWVEHWGTENLTLKDIGRKLSNLKGWELMAQEQEERRPYILWVMLKKTNGS